MMLWCKAANRMVVAYEADRPAGMAVTNNADAAALRVANCAWKQSTLRIENTFSLFPPQNRSAGRR
jgi:hypothetical protein